MKSVGRTARDGAGRAHLLTTRRSAGGHQKRTERLARTCSPQLHARDETFRSQAMVRGPKEARKVAEGQKLQGDGQHGRRRAKKLMETCGVVFTARRHSRP